jgi:hypothetical protein
MSKGFNKACLEGVAPKADAFAKPATAQQIHPCHTCRWAVLANDVLRCHSHPPQLRVPYDNMASWPVVPKVGGGCRLHEQRMGI